MCARLHLCVEKWFTKYNLALTPAAWNSKTSYAAAPAWLARMSAPAPRSRSGICWHPPGLQSTARRAHSKSAPGSAIRILPGAHCAFFRIDNPLPALKSPWIHERYTLSRSVGSTLRPGCHHPTAAIQPCADLRPLHTLRTRLLAKPGDQAAGRSSDHASGAPVRRSPERQYRDRSSQTKYPGVAAPRAPSPHLAHANSPGLAPFAHLNSPNIIPPSPCLSDSSMIILS